jgi:ankyrin repeat protein
VVVHFELSTPASAEAVETIEDKVHSAAQSGNGAQLTKLMRMDTQLAHLEDANGWTPLHEASRAGHVDAVRLLLSYAADPNHRTSGGRGGTALYYAAKYQGRNHPVSSILALARQYCYPWLENQVNLVVPYCGTLDSTRTVRLAGNKGSSNTDRNGWTAHSSRFDAGHLELVKLLFEWRRLNHRTNAEGSSTLYLAEKYHGENHLVTAFLRNNGGHSVASQLEL